MTVAGPGRRDPAQPAPELGLRSARGPRQAPVVTLDPERRQGSITWMGTDDVGRILFAGTAMGSTLFDVLVGRIRPSGEPDRSFGGDGMIRTNADPYQDVANDALLGGRDRLVVGGGTETGAGAMFGLLLRYLSS
jgi:hypothetical protein